MLPGVLVLGYVPGGGSGGGLGSCVSSGGRHAKAGRDARWCATSTGRCQRSSTERSVGAAGQLKRWLVVWESELHWGQRSVSAMPMASL